VFGFEGLLFSAEWKSAYAVFVHITWPELMEFQMLERASGFASEQLASRDDRRS